MIKLIMMALFIATPAFATGTVPPIDKPPIAKAKAKATSNSSSKATTNINVAAGHGASHDYDIDENKFPANAPSLGLEPCTTGGGVSGPGYGASLGGSDTLCELRNAAIFHAERGDEELASEFAERHERRMRARDFWWWAEYVPVLNWFLR